MRFLTAIWPLRLIVSLHDQSPTLTALQGGLTLIDPRFDLMSHAHTRAPQFLKDHFTVSSVTGMLRSQMAALLAVGKRLPHRLESITADLEQGTLGMQVRSFATSDDRLWVTSLVNESISALLAVTAIIGAIILIVTQGPLIAPNVRLYAFVGYMLGVSALYSPSEPSLGSFSGGHDRERPTGDAKRNGLMPWKPKVLWIFV